MEPALSSIYWGCCKDRLANATLESALMYFQPREILIIGPLSAPATRLIKAFQEQSAGCSLEQLPAAATGSQNALLQVSQVELCSFGHP
jgi:hypothetical protein